MLLFLIKLAFAEPSDNLQPHERIYNQAAMAMNSGDAASCLKHLSTVEKEYLYTDSFLRLGYICAISGSQLNAAELLRDELGLLYLPESGLDVHHAFMLRQQKRYQEALDVLIPESWTTEKHRQLGTTMQAILHADLKQWEQAWLLAGSPFVERKAKLFIAQELRNHHELAKSRALYDLACAGLDRPEQYGCASVMNIPSLK